jgi:type II secretory pathway pseudopilin PulG
MTERSIPRVNTQRGFVLIAALLVMVVLFILGAVFMTLSSTESRIAFNDKNATRTLYVAEMAVERARRDLKYDADFDLDGITNQYFASPTPLAGGTPIDCAATIIWQGFPPQQRCYDLGSPIPAEPMVVPPYPADDVYFQTLYTNVNVDAFGDGSTYTLKLGLLNSNKLTIRAAGTGPLQSRKTVDVRVEVRDLSVWNNAIFAGGGGAGARINGNVKIAGSVHILGQGLEPTDTAADFGGSAGIFNWYNGIDAVFTGKLPNINPLTLDAEVRVKQGQILMNSGASRVGNASGDAVPAGIKRRLDGVYNTNGFAGSFGDTYVHSDNGVFAKYDLPADYNIPFPSLTGPRPDGLLGTYENYLDANSWDPVTAGVLPGSAVSGGSNLTIYGNTASFDVTDGTGRFAWDSISQTLTVQGIIRIPGAITLGGTTGPTKITTIMYTTVGVGGTLYAKQAGADWSESGTSGAHQVSITVNSDLLPVGVFPTGDTLGLLAKDRLVMARSQNQIAAAVFAENQVQVTKQYQVVGAIVSRFFDMGTNTPRVYQMPNLARYLPPGMPGGQILNFVKILSWREI